MSNQDINAQQNAVITSGDANAVLRVTGIINFKNVVNLRQQGKLLLAQQALTSVTIDLQTVEQSDNSGLVLLIAWMRDARELGKTINFRHIPHFLQRMAEVFGLNSILLGNN